MTVLIDCRTALSRSAQSPVGFARTGGGSWSEWDRYLTLYGKPAFHLGNICNTCSFFFERLEGTNQRIEVDAFADKLASGLAVLSEEVVDRIAQILPAGEYIATLLRAVPSLVLPGGAGDYFSENQPQLWDGDSPSDPPHHPRTEYYLLDTSAQRRPQLFEFVIPMFPGSQLRQQEVFRYSRTIANGAAPTAIAVSILDVKAPSDITGDDKAHFCLAHYLLDGHHKTRAAMQAQKPITLMSLLAVSQGIATLDHCETVLGWLGGRRSDASA